MYVTKRMAARGKAVSKHYIIIYFTSILFPSKVIVKVGNYNFDMVILYQENWSPIPVYSSEPVLDFSVYLSLQDHQ